MIDKISEFTLIIVDRGDLAQKTETSEFNKIGIISGKARKPDLVIKRDNISFIIVEFD